MLAEQLLGGFAIGCVYSLIALGYTMLIRAIGLVNFAQGEVMMVGALIGWTLLTSFPLPYPLVLVLAMALTALLGVLIDRLVYRPVQRRGAPTMNVIITTIGVSIALRNAAQLIWGSEPLRYPTVFATEPIAIGGLTVAPQNVSILLVGLGFMGLLQLFFQRTRTGLAMRAAAQDPDMARMMGVGVDRMVTYTYAISAALGAAGGVLLAPIFFASFDMGYIGVKSFAAATIGGLGNVPGAMVGGIVLGVVETLGAAFISSAYKDALGYGIMIALLLFVPSGLFVRAQRRS
ncbi:MAG TPA: branched-chain amino acid ABC transporter permease [Chloroflexota bacterium]|nr:branched-chain amino acid ABC transporter permease [Chloroflexota bacterium]